MKRHALNHALRALTLTLVGAVALSGCGFHGIYSLPLPGGVGTGPDAYTITVEFADVTDLVPQSVVKVNDVSVGSVQDIALDGWHAVVTCRVKNSVHLPDNAVAKVSQTSLLGEKYVSISAPSGEKPRGQLGNGDVIPLSRTGRYPEVEEVLSSLSLLLNGGGLQQIKTINAELNAALSGREDRIRDLLRQLHTFVGGLNEQKSEIVRALEGLDRLTATLREQKKTIDDAVVKIGPGLKVLADQRAELTKMLVALSDLGDVATRVINESQDDLLANLQALEPILDRLADAGADLPKALELLLTFPFPKTATKGIRGDWTNLYMTTDLDLDTLLHNLLANGSGASSNGSSSGKRRGGKKTRPSPSPSKSSTGGSLFPGSPGSPGSPESPGSPGSPGSGGDGGGSPSGNGSDQEGSGDGGLLDLLTGGSG